MSAWAEYKLNENLVSALVTAGFPSPTEIQERTLVFAIHPVDLIIASKTVLLANAGFRKNTLLPRASLKFDLQRHR
jgi:hypothetical protein